MNHAFYSGTISHHRHIPREHAFSYDFFMWFLNLDALEKLPELGVLFSPDRFCLNRYRREDYTAPQHLSHADAIRQKMFQLTGEEVSGQVCALLNVSALGLYFSPVNFYWGMDSSSQFTHFLAEVSNIPWNERHYYGYLLSAGKRTHSHPKAFHVSPFNPTDQNYTWHIGLPEKTLALGLEVNDQRGHIFDARLDLKRFPLTRRAVAGHVIRKPVTTAFIVAGIYWQAFRLYLKGVPYIPYQKEST